MSRFKEYLKQQNIELSPKRYFIDAMSAMAQGLFASLLIGTILKTIGEQFHIGFLTEKLFTIKIQNEVVTASLGELLTIMTGPAIAVAIGYSLHASPLVLFSLVGVGAAANQLGGAGGPLAVYAVAIIACECGKLVSKRTKVDILVTPAVTTLVGVLLAILIAPPIGKAASWVGNLIMWATELQHRTS